MAGRTRKTKTKPKTLLKDFIDQQMASYFEPQRKGTPKGEQIGLSDKKYCAVLNLLYNHKLKDIASWSNISYGVLRKWKTEAQFLSELHLLETKYALFFCAYIAKLGERIFSGTKTNSLDWRIISNSNKLTDVGFYSKSLKERIKNAVLQFIMCDIGDDTAIDIEDCIAIEFPKGFPGKKTRTVKSEDVFLAGFVIRLLLPDGGDTMIRNFLVPLKSEATTQLLDLLGKILEKPTMTKADKKTAKSLIWKLKLMYSDK